MRKRVVVETLRDILSEDELPEVPAGVDVIGNIAIIKIPEKLERRKHEIGERLLSKMQGVKSVYRQSAPARQGDRVRGIEWLAGAKSTETCYREHGCTFQVDLSKVYFSPRLSYERARIARLVSDGEVVVNMFAGVGTFSILIAKNASPAHVYSIDNNPDAHRYAVLNCKKNRVECIVTPLLGDAKKYAEELGGIADRVLMPLPELAIEYLPSGIQFLKNEGAIHLYVHIIGGHKKKAVESAICEVLPHLEENSKVKQISGRLVRGVGSRRYQVAVDAEVEKLGKH
ncbi:MAG: class I SAM-dependent methyltransferase family protein [Candidatus Methanomethylicia archaeon]|nr:class I SAM-dependent methyltransferase family protein [Candidatus Methanomethylicia archaeon]